MAKPGYYPVDNVFVISADCKPYNNTPKLNHIHIKGDLHFLDKECVEMLMSKFPQNIEVRREVQLS